MNRLPLVSIVVPNYNHLKFLPERLSSIERQTFTDYELILLDDASTDGSREYLEAYANAQKATWLPNQHNSGSPFVQWNRGVQAARGQYVWLAESDDSARPELLDQLVAVLNRNSGVGLVEADSQCIDEAGDVTGPLLRNETESFTDHWQQSFQSDGHDEIQNFLYVQNTIPSASAVLFRRETYLQAGLAKTDFRISGDWLQWIRLLMVGDRAFLAQPLSYSRIHTASQRHRTSNDGRYEIESVRVQRWIRKRLHVRSDRRRLGAERYATGWLQSLRAGRYTGSYWRHWQLFWHLLLADVRVGGAFAAQLPQCIATNRVKRTLNRRKQQS